MFRTIGVVASIPGPGVKPGTGLALESFKASSHMLEVTGTNAGGGPAGRLDWLRWFPPPPVPLPAGAGTSIDLAGEWRIWLEDRPIIVAAGASTFSGRLELPYVDDTHWLLLAAGGADATAIDADAQASEYSRG